MAIIHEDLKQQSQEKPQNKYSVLITLKGETLPEDLKNKGKFIMGNKIFSANINGQDIQSLVNHPDVEAIEPDIEMGIM